MRRYFGITISIVLALVVLIALSAAGNLEFDRPRESELEPIRSSYNSGPTGTRALYQLLEEFGTNVERWRDSFALLKTNAGEATLIVVGPFQRESWLSEGEAEALQKWIAEGGNVLIVSRFPQAEFGDSMLQAKIIAKDPNWYGSPESLVDPQADKLIAQPTDLTKNLRALSISTLAARLKFEPPELDGNEDPNATPTPSPTPTATPEEAANPDEETEQEPFLYAPVVHLGDNDGAVLADFQYGKGRLIFLTDPFVIANNGIAREGNLTLTMNLVRALTTTESGAPRKIFFDEYHHGYRGRSNPLVVYLRGTPTPWLLVQGLLLSLLLVYSFGKRFARPLPMPHVDRHSPLEFVGSMANLQQVARARDLALENIYPRFKTQLCRRLGLSSRARTEDIIAALRRRRLPVSELEVRQTLSDAEVVLAGEKIDDAQLVNLIARMRRIAGQLKK
ncbi:MAG TPA: DUF4350 domain-containing protein [Blastocatellia bacterium]|nr:DUF4350 domain-containing protein [Blastocatellia bacterium]HMV82892.1 DUF4350 domain-containing protein [Blastocatellia bacterium]HMZ22255.1 DUF4350 domain-containing protein [Blastocatellia bacterium]HNG29561.1 DUF4350 domain-containing protein [Blastocatellia bacterium]